MTPHHPLDIPDFLRNQSAEPADRKRRRWTKDMNFNEKPTKVEEAATRQLRKELEKRAAEKKAERLAALKERFGR